MLKLLNDDSTLTGNSCGKRRGCGFIGVRLSIFLVCLEL